MKRRLLLVPLVFSLCATISPDVAGAGPNPALGQDQTPEPTRINPAIQWLEQDKPVYYTSTTGGGYDDGMRLSQSESDDIKFEVEHGAFDMVELADFMRGLVDGGPTPTGHRTPAVIVSLPVPGLDEAGMRANSRVIQQPAETFQIATLGSARTLGIDDAFGSLETANRADFILLDGSPVDDTTNTRHLRSVWIGGLEADRQ